MKNKSLNEIKKSQFKATENIFRKKKIPFRSFYIKKRSEETLGELFTFFILEARFVTTEQGTGIVHCAPSHGPDDFNLCLNNGIKAIETVDGDGKYTKNVDLFEGIHIFKANPIVIEKLKEQKKLLSNGEQSLLL